MKFWLGMVLGLTAGLPAVSVPGQTPAAPYVVDVLTGGKKMLLWPDKPRGGNGAPGAVGNEAIDRPLLYVYLPKGENATKTGVIVAPGGGYQHLSMKKEGEDVALWLNARGVAAFVLVYRLGPTYHHPIEIGDAQRAIRTVRARASEYGISSDHLGMWGFSAGGHLAATAGTKFDAGKAGDPDPIERQSSRPDFLVLSYPVITFEDPYGHTGSRKYLLGEHPDPALVAELSADQQVTRDTPPSFLYSTTDDKTVPVLNSVMFYTALVKAGVPAEMHIFQNGPHGTGLAQGYPDLKVWPDLLATWMRARGYMGKGSE
ncbi:alpha/beta hydrolase [Granulicella sibirica]|uniref:Endo-1,4-beta-xylanase B n=1 Tax=Granulicella sibirica TaxID=2479048 RepID=A0A4Q0T4J2_9BACT|nr:alpha/beta hydrolase [Granulicella sibirica]RXH56486.1 endo-1,4-beta-xylanase B [Granulicella sibirica]